jgi:hypothetical protein
MGTVNKQAAERAAKSEGKTNEQGAESLGFS